MFLIDVYIQQLDLGKLNLPTPLASTRPRAATQRGSGDLSDEEEGWLNRRPRDPLDVLLEVCISEGHVEDVEDGEDGQYGEDRERFLFYNKGENVSLFSIERKRKLAPSL